MYFAAVPRYALPLPELPQRCFDAVEAAERGHARTVVARDGHAVAAIVPIEDLDKIDPPDPGLTGGDPLLSLCGTLKQDTFVDNVLYAYGVAMREPPSSWGQH